MNYEAAWVKARHQVELYRNRAKRLEDSRKDGCIAQARFTGQVVAFEGVMGFMDEIEGDDEDLGDDGWA